MESVNMLPLVFGAVIYFAMLIAMFTCFIFVILAVWRAMKAHESIAASLQQIALQGQRPPQP